MTAIPKNVYFDVLDEIVDKYNNTVQRTIKMKPIDVTDDFYAEYNENPNKTDPKFKAGDHIRISKQKNIFAKGYTPNCSEEGFVISKVKNTVPWTYVINNLNGEEITGSFMKQNCKRQIKKNLEQKKYLKEKVINCLSNGKDMIIVLIVGLTKKTLYKNESSKPFNSGFGDSIKVKIDLSNYPTKTDIKNISHVDTSSFVLKTNLASLKTEVNKLGIDKLAPVFADLSKLSNVVKNDIVKKLSMINWLQK